MTIDVAVIGSGPAGWATAHACALRGLEVVLIAPDPERVWPQTFALWVDQASEVAIDVPFARVWRSAQVLTETGRNPLGVAHEVNRSYAVIDNGTLLDRFIGEGERTGSLSVRDATVRSIEHGSTRSVVEVEVGRPTSARLVIDATGAGSSFVEREFGRGVAPSVALQSAYGIVVEATDIPFEADVAVFMDWRGPRRAAPSFLYALNFDSTWLFEETSLARMPPLDANELKVRLAERLDRYGIRIQRLVREEIVSIPMSVPMPILGQRTVAVGGAAGLIHPATGYSVAASLVLAPKVADALAKAFDRGDDLDACARAAWDVVWPSERLRARALESYGLSRLLAMNQTETQQFFNSFFGLAPEDVAAYLDGNASAERLARVMWKVFRNAPLRVRQKLALGNPRALVHALRQ